MLKESLCGEVSNIQAMSQLLGRSAGVRLVSLHQPSNLASYVLSCGKQLVLSALLLEGK